MEPCYPQIYFYSACYNELSEAYSCTVSQIDSTVKVIISFKHVDL